MKNGVKCYKDFFNALKTNCVRHTLETTLPEGLETSGRRVLQRGGSVAADLL